MGWREEYEERQKKIQAEVDALIPDVIGNPDALIDLKTRFFKDFGCINFMSEDKSHELCLAQEFHRRHKAMFPEMHQMTESEPYRCYHVSKCSCGFCTACDSSD